MSIYDGILLIFHDKDVDEKLTYDKKKICFDIFLLLT